MRTFTFIAAATLVLVGCAAKPQYTPVSTKAVAAKPPDCAFDVLSLRPGRAVEELGIIDFEGGETSNVGERRGVPSSAAELRDKIRPEVCRAGGDAVLTEVNGRGQYVRATVVRYVPETQGSNR